ncbi:MAG TPA: amino acid adenylation domain-containing protein [Pyrinomonadaceae bacterium]|nr:amino acid adenylation domain-containing protein [Pyrinomonadaceae bacterium]
MNAADIEDIYGLSPAQQGILFEELAAPSEGCYVVQLLLTLAGRLDEGALARAFALACERHPVLRTSFHWQQAGRPLQVVRRRAPFAPPAQLDWRGLGEPEWRARLRGLLDEDRRRGFDFAQPPLMRLTLIRTGGDGRHLLLTFHHLLLDGWSLSALLAEVFSSYEALAGGRRPAPPPPPRPFRDFIAWLQRQDMARAESFWREYLRGFREPTRLPLTAPGPPPGPHPARGHAEHRVVLTGEATRALQRLARTHRITLNTVAQGAWAVLLSRYAGSGEVVFGATVSGRPAELEGVERMLGLFINTLPVRARVEGGARVGEWLRGLQGRGAEARQYEYAPLSEVRRWGEVGGGLPLFDSILVFENYPVESGLRERAGADALLRVERVEGFERTNFGLALAVIPGRELELRLGYDPARFGRGAIGRLVAHLSALLAEMAANPEQRVSQLPSLTDEERALLAGWNDTRRDYGRGLCAHELFERQAALTPEAAAVVCRGARLTYAELDARANQLARHLRAAGVGPESRVGILFGRSAEVIVSALGVLKAGAAYVPLDPEYPLERIAYALEDCGAAVVLTETALAEKLRGRVSARVVRVDAERGRIARRSGDRLSARVDPSNLAYVIYTSGSTGRPKGVGVAHAALSNLLCWHREHYGVGPGDRVTHSAGQAFDASVWEIWPCLTGGATLYVLGAERAGTPDELWRWLTDNAVTHCFLPTPRAEALLPSAEASAAGRGADRPALKHLWAGGDALRRRPKEGLPFAFGNLYGPTECTVVSVCAEIDGGAAEARTPPIGRPVANTQVHVLDGGLRPVPVGAQGELYIGGRGVARGYLGRPALTAERFVPDPFTSEPGARLYRTGDVGRWLEDGNLEFVCRVDEQLKIRGQRVEPGEVEAALRRHPLVGEAVVLARGSGDSEKTLVAYVSARAGESAPTHPALRRHLAASLPEYMIPSAFVALERLPLTPNGKVDRRALPEPERARSLSGAEGAPTRTPAEEVLAGIWSELLGVERVGARDDFFELGGHSLLAIQLASRVGHVFGVEMSVRAVFDAPTLAGFAAQVERALGGAGLMGATADAAGGRVGRAARPAELPLSSAQQRIWSSEQLGRGGSLYNITTAARLTGRLRVAALGQAIRELVRRHEPLRTVVKFERGRATQAVAEAGPLPLPCVDLGGLGEGARAAELFRLGREEAKRPFDLGAAPLLRATLFRLGEGEHVVLLVTHHIASDAWSLGILLREVAALYAAYAEGRPSPLPELPIQYADYALWQRARMGGGLLDARLAYWRRRLGGPLPPLALPTDRARPERMTFRGARESFALPEELTARLKALSREAGATLFMTLLAGFKALLRRHTGQDDVIVGTPVAGRDCLEVEGLIGCFVNTLALRTDLSGDPTFRELLRRVRETTLGAYAHRDVPFERVVEELRPERDPSRTPLFQVTFGMQNAPLEVAELPGLTLRPLSFDDDTARFDLTVWLAETEAGLSAAWTYNTDLFDAATVLRLHSLYERLLSAAAARPDAPLGSLELQTEAERAERRAREQEFARLGRARFVSAKPRPVSVE